MHPPTTHSSESGLSHKSWSQVGEIWVPQEVPPHATATEAWLRRSCTPFTSRHDPSVLSSSHRHGSPRSVHWSLVGRVHDVGSHTPVSGLQDSSSPQSFGVVAHPTSSQSSLLSVHGSPSSHRAAQLSLHAPCKASPFSTNLSAARKPMLEVLRRCPSVPASGPGGWVRRGPAEARRQPEQLQESASYRGFLPKESSCFVIAWIHATMWVEGFCENAYCCVLVDNEAPLRGWEPRPKISWRLWHRSSQVSVSPYFRVPEILEPLPRELSLLAASTVQERSSRLIQNEDLSNYVRIVTGVDDLSKAAFAGFEKGASLLTQVHKARKTDLFMMPDTSEKGFESMKCDLHVVARMIPCKNLQEKKKKELCATEFNEDQPNFLMAKTQ